MISAFALLVYIFIGTASFAVKLKICTIKAGIKKYKSLIKKKEKNHDKIELFAKAKLNTLEVIICKALIDSNISMMNLFQ